MFSYGPDILHQCQLACLITWTTISEPRRLCQPEIGTEGHKNSFFSLKWWLWDYSAPLPMVFKVSLLHPLGRNSSSLAMITLLSIVSGANSQIRCMRWHCQEEKLKYTMHVLALPGGEGEVETKTWNFSMCNCKEPCMEKKVERVYTTHIYYKIVDRNPLGRMF